MANENDPSFSMNAAQLLAKLHLAAQQQVTIGPVLNTGITNPVDKGNPEKPGSTEFDLKNTTHEYQVGICRSDFGYFPQIDLKKDKKVNTLQSDVEKARQKIKTTTEKGNSGEELKVENEKLIEAQQTLLKHIKENYEAAFVLSKSDPDVKKLLDALKQAEKIDPKKEAAESTEKAAPEEDKNKSLLAKTEESLKKQLFSDLILEDTIDTEKDSKPDEDNPIEVAFASLKSAIDKENELRLEEKYKNIKAWRSTTYKDGIQKYFQTFVGKSNASKIKESEIAILFLNNDSSKKQEASALAKEHIKNYKIVPIDEKELANAEHEFSLKNKGTQPFKPTICFVVGYSVESETM